MMPKFLRAVNSTRPSEAHPQRSTMNQLDRLKTMTPVVADTGNFLQMAQYAPRDATTNPSLILKAVQQPEYASLLTDAVEAHRREPPGAPRAAPGGGGGPSPGAARGHRRCRARALRARDPEGRARPRQHRG